MFGEFFTINLTLNVIRHAFYHSPCTVDILKHLSLPITASKKTFSMYTVHGVERYNITLFALFKNGHYAADQVYVYVRMCPIPKEKSKFKKKLDFFRPPKWANLFLS